MLHFTKDPLVGARVEIKFRAPHAIDATCFRSCVCAMAWRFHAIDATLSPWPLEPNSLVDFHTGVDGQDRDTKRARK